MEMPDCLRHMTRSLGELAEAPMVSIIATFLMAAEE